MHRLFRTRIAAVRRPRGRGAGGATTPALYGRAPGTDIDPSGAERTPGAPEPLMRLDGLTLR